MSSGLDAGTAEDAVRRLKAGAPRALGGNPEILTHRARSSTDPTVSSAADQISRTLLPANRRWSPHPPGSEVANPAAWETAHRTGGTLVSPKRPFAAQMPIRSNTGKEKSLATLATRMMNQIGGTLVPPIKPLATWRPDLPLPRPKALALRSVQRPIASEAL